MLDSNKHTNGQTNRLIDNAKSRVASQLKRETLRVLKGLQDEKQIRNRGETERET